MIPVILASTAAASLAGGLINAIQGGSASKKIDPTAFDQHLASQVKKSEEAPSAQTLIALQKSQGLSMDQKIALGRLLLNQTVQVIDSSGNNVVGKVTHLSLAGGDVRLSIGGRSFPSSSVQAVLQGIPEKL